MSRKGIRTDRGEREKEREGGGSGNLRERKGGKEKNILFFKNF